MTVFDDVVQKMASGQQLAEAVDVVFSFVKFLQAHDVFMVHLAHHLQFVKQAFLTVRAGEG